MSLKDEWNIEMALEVLSSDTIDSKSWIDAVKWLILYGPKEIRSYLLESSASAIKEEFPELIPIGCDEHGADIYDLDNLAETLGIEPERLQDDLLTMEEEHDFPFIDIETKKDMLH